MVYRNTHSHAVTYHKGENVLWQAEPAVVTQGGHMFGAITIEWRGKSIEFSPYDLVWPDKVFS